MTEKDLMLFNDIKERIDVLEEELYALFNAKGKKCHFGKNGKLFLSSVRTKKKDYPHDLTIELSLSDVRALQNNRHVELDALRKILKEGDSE